MSNKYNTTYIGDISNINANSYSSSENWEYVNYLDTGNITKNKIDEIQYIDLSVDKLPSRAKRKVIKNSIIYSTVRPNQQHFGFIDKQPDNFLISTGFAVIDVNPDIANPKFVYYYLTQDKITEGLHALAEQSVSAYPSIKPSDVGNVKIFLPDLTTQEKIAQVLSSLDDKIELNNKINQNLEQQAQAIFNTYIAKYSSTKYKVKDVILTANTGADAIQKAPIVDYDTGIRCVRVGDLSNNRNFWQWGFTKVTNDVFEQYQLKRDDIIVTRTATLGLNRLITENLNAVYNNGLIRITVDNNKIFPLLLYQHFQTKDFFNYISRIESETSVRPNMKINYLLDYEFSYLKLTEQNELVKILTPLLQTVEINNVENEKLTQLRDTLLPKLMSGEIDVDKVEV